MTAPLLYSTLSILVRGFLRGRNGTADYADYADGKNRFVFIRDIRVIRGSTALGRNARTPRGIERIAVQINMLRRVTRDWERSHVILERSEGSESRTVLRNQILRCAPG